VEHADPPINRAGRISLAGLGKPLATGRTCEVYPFGEGRVLKLLLPDFERLGRPEAEVATLVGQVYPGAPACLGTTTVAGRFGLIYERIEGESMEERLDRRPWQLDGLARDLADLHAAMHATDGAGLPEQMPRLRDAIERARADAPPGFVEAALARLASLQPGEAVCHGDLHPGNVLLGADRAVVIDWENAHGGNAAGDVARTLFLCRDTPLDRPASPVIRRAIGLARQRFARRYLARYRERRRLDAAELDGWRLPILVARLAEGIEAERALLRRLIEREIPAVHSVGRQFGRR
jgi:aminoglycoside phosphotransferase (APT) family kinase protein